MQSCAAQRFSRASGDVDKDWPRWYRRAIEKSAQQLYAAERALIWLVRKYPDTLKRLESLVVPRLLNPTIASDVHIMCTA